LRFRFPSAGFVRWVPFGLNGTIIGRNWDSERLRVLNVPVREMGAGWPSTLRLNGTICVWESSPTDAVDGTTEAGGPRAGSMLSGAGIRSAWEY
jgi:hypothetical protein